MPLTTWYSKYCISKTNKNNWSVPNISFNCSVSFFYLKRYGCGFTEILVDIVGWIMWALICWHWVFLYSCGLPKSVTESAPLVNLWYACPYSCCHNYTSWLKSKDNCIAAYLRIKTWLLLHHVRITIIIHLYVYHVYSGSPHDAIASV